MSPALDGRRDPGAEGGLAPETTQTPVGPQESLLRDIVRFLVAPQEPVGEAVDSLTVTHDQAVEGGLVALQKPVHEPFVIVLTIRANFHRLL